MTVHLTINRNGSVCVVNRRGENIATVPVQYDALVNTPGKVEFVMDPKRIEFPTKSFWSILSRPFDQKGVRAVLRDKSGGIVANLWEGDIDLWSETLVLEDTRVT